MTAIPYEIKLAMNCRFTRSWMIAVILLISSNLPLLQRDLHAQIPNQINGRATGGSIRIATFNASLYGKEAGQVLARLRGGKNQQAIQLAAIVQSIRPDILLVNEIDYDDAGLTVNSFGKHYLEVGQNGLSGVKYPHRYAVPSNTGQLSGLDLDGNGKSRDANDAWGYGVYPGQYAMAIYSRFPIVESGIRTFQKYRWSQLPNALRPMFPGSDKSYYSDEVWEKLRLSSKNHVDVPIRVGKKVIHILASHPTPPVFDGPDDHNGCRNHDEIKFWTDYLTGRSSTHLIDDRGTAGGLSSDASFIIAGDLNSDPVLGDSRHSAINQLLEHPKVQDPQPTSPGAAESTGSKNPCATADFGKDRKMRVDYVLPSRDFSIRGSGVFWPATQNSESRWIRATDHRLVWIEVELQP